MKFGVTFFGNIIILGYLAVVEGRAFINPFNVAIKTEFTEEGNTFSFVYPKNSYRVNVNVNKEKINTHEFNISQLFGQFARSLGKKLSFVNPFALSGGLSKQPTTTTTESSFDFPDDPDFSVSGSSTETFDVSTEEETNGNGHSNEESSTKSGYKYDIQQPTQTSPKTDYLPPSTVYLPPKSKRQ